MFLDEVFSAKAEELREVGGKTELLNTSMSKQCLSMLGDILKSEVLEVILRIMARSIENRSAYSNDMLHIAFDYEVNRKGRLPKETWLFGIIKETILKILSDTENKKDWYWMYVNLAFLVMNRQCFLFESCVYSGYIQGKLLVAVEHLVRKGESQGIEIQNFVV